MRVLVYGAGAIGTYIGGSLLAAGHRVTFQVRPATAEALRANGIRIGPMALRPRIAASPAEALVHSPEVIVFALKSYDTAAALAELRGVTAAPPPLLCLQNGVDNESEMAHLFGGECVMAGTVTTAVSKTGAGQVRVERERGVGVALGHSLSTPLVKTLRGAGLRVSVYQSAGPMKWSKLLTNLIGNATSAILDMSVAELFANPQTFKIEIAMLRECLAVMRALQYEVVDLPKTPVRALAFAAQRLPRAAAQLVLKRAVASGRGGKMPSFHIDLHGGRGQTEVSWLNGAVARYGEIHGVPTPVNRALTEILEGLSAGRLNPEDFRRKPATILQLINA
jgi:2-dehydropantoate 2-reductase